MRATDRATVEAAARTARTDRRNVSTFKGTAETVPRTATTDGTSDTGVDAISHPDAGGTCRTEPPTVHRPSASTCLSHTSDAGVDSGIPSCMPPHDACLVDSDCGSSGVCDCETPRCAEPFAVSGNVCVPSDCRVDSDCACGFCAGDASCGGLQAYHCTTPRDECSTGADCQDGGTLTQCQWSTDHWACVQGMGCPG
jgi:hypothetical protein